MSETPTSSGPLLDLVPVVPVVVIDDLDHAVPLARALVAGGVPVVPRSAFMSAIKGAS